MNIAERRRPQDGQITFRTREKEVDIRVATSNTIYGEMSVMRVLDKTFAFYTLPQLGFLPQTYDAYMEMLKSPFGMILMSGPTGSGKTTTLYASVSQIDSVDAVSAGELLCVFRQGGDERIGDGLIGKLVQKLPDVLVGPSGPRCECPRCRRPPGDLI